MLSIISLFKTTSTLNSSLETLIKLEFKTISIVWSNFSISMESVFAGELMLIFVDEIKSLIDFSPFINLTKSSTVSPVLSSNEEI